MCVLSYACISCCLLLWPWPYDLDMHICTGRGRPTVCWRYRCPFALAEDSSAFWSVFTAYSIFYIESNSTQTFWHCVTAHFLRVGLNSRCFGCVIGLINNMADDGDIAILKCVHAHEWSKCYVNICLSLYRAGLRCLKGCVQKLRSL